MTITIEKSGRRYYVAGNTFAIKDVLRSKGFKWDSDKKQWYTGKKELADEMSGKEISPPKTDVADIEVIGKSQYKGRFYYVRWAGVTKRGNYSFRLCSLDGEIDFWADGSPNNGNSAPEHEKQARWEKVYQDKRSLKGIRDFIEENKRAKSEGFDDVGHRRAVHSGRCRAPGCGAAAEPSGYCRACEFDEFDN